MAGAFCFMDFGQLRVTYVGDERPVVRAAGIVDRINAQTARNAAANDRLVERSKRTLADVQAREARRGADAFIRELERTRRAERQSAGGPGGGGEGAGALSTALGGRLAFAGAGPAAAVGAMTVAFGAAAKAGVGYKGSIDSLNRSFTTLMGSQEAATAHLKELQEFTSRTPFEFLEIARASQRFQAMGIEAGKVTPLLKDIANAIATIGGGQEEIDRVALAIAQVNAKGRVMTQEMNQLSEVGISGWKALQAETGKTREELMKMVEAGEVSAETFNKAFHGMYGDGKALQQQMETLGGSQARLTDEGRKLLAYAYTPLHGALRDIVVEANKLRTEGWETERMFTALASASENFLDNFLPTRMAGIADRLRQMRSLMGGGGQAPANWGAAEGPWGQDAPINIPEQFKYKPKISDSDLLGKMKQEDERAREEAARKAEEAMRRARGEAERQSDVIKSISQDYAEASTRVSGYSGATLQLEASLYKLSKGYHTLSDENKRLAQAEVNKLFAAKTEEARLEENARLAAAFEQSIRSNAETLNGEKTAIEQLNDAYVAWAKNTMHVTGQTANLTPELDKLMMQARGVAAEVDHLNALLKLGEQNRESSWRQNVNDLLQPGKIAAPQVPDLKPLDLSNVREDYWKTFKESWHESLQFMRKDGIDIFADMFTRIGEGWRSAAGGLVIDFAQALNQMAAQAAANAVWNALLNAGTSLLGGALGGVFGGIGGNLPAPNVGGGVWAGVPFAGKFAAGGYIPPGKWGMTGEEGPEPVFGGRTGATILPNSNGTTINKTTIINFQPRVTPNSVTSRRSSRETFEALLGFVR